VLICAQRLHLESSMCVDKCAGSGGLEYATIKSTMVQVVGQTKPQDKLIPVTSPVSNPTFLVLHLAQTRPDQLLEDSRASRLSDTAPAQARAPGILVLRLCVRAPSAVYYL
jgi:hypothetical protein